MIKQKIRYNSPMAYYQIAKGIKKFINNNTVIICIGTDKCIGDCLGPLVGTLLHESFLPLPIYGTISSPIHALNLDTNLKEINCKHPNSCIIGIVDSSDYSNIFSARSIRLSFISDMAKVISHGILEAYSNYQNNLIE